jgi:prophage regulatory protein
MTGLERTSIYCRMNPDSQHYDPSFPRSISLGGRAVAWIEAELEGWIAARIEASRRASKPVSRRARG